MKTLCIWLLVFFGTCSGVVADTEAGGQAAFPAEVQINLCSEPDQIIQALHLKHQKKKSKEAWYFDTAELELFRNGVLFRLRISDHASELTLKVAHQDCPRINKDLLPADQAKCEYDMHGGKLEGAVSINKILEGKEVDDLFQGSTTLADLLSSVQVRYLQEKTAVWPLPAELKRLGPGKIETYHQKGQPFAVEIWYLPSGLRTIEISEKCPLAEAGRVKSHLEEVLAGNQVKVCEDQGSQAGRKLKEYVQGL